MSIQPGTICYLVHVSAVILGRVVTVTGPAATTFVEGKLGLFYPIDALWFSEIAEYCGRHVVSEAHQLIPIAGPHADLPGQHERKPQKVIE